MESRPSFISSNTLILALEISAEDGGCENIITINALQPEFRLGSLYDRRTDNLLPSLTLWAEKSFENKGFIDERPSSHHEWFVDSHNTFSAKAKKLDIEDGLMLSVMTGMVDLKGHAKYLNDTSSSRKVAKATITYKETTVYRQLTSDAIHSSDYKEKFAEEELEKDFTHIVAGIHYGGTFTMVFERDLKEGEKKEDIEKLMCDILEEFPQNKFGLSVKDKYKIVLTDTENFKCNLYSDFRSNERIASWDKALAVFKSLSSKLTGSGTDDLKGGVPVKIRLLPKTYFGAKHGVLNKGLRSGIVNRSKKVVETLTEAINESCDLLKQTDNFPILKEKISRFLKCVEDYKKVFEQDILGDLVKSIRRGFKNAKLLIDAVEQHDQSAFGSLKEWLKKINQVVKRLLVIQNQLPGNLVPFLNESFVQDSEKKISIVLLLKVFKSEDKFIDEMVKYCNNPTKNEAVVTTEKNLDGENWIEDKSFIFNLHKMAYQIRDFASANLSNKDTSFFVRQEEYEDKPKGSIEVWKEFGNLNFEKSFEPPTEVQDLQVEKYSHDAIGIKWNVPKEGASNISNYSIEVSLQVENAEEKWEFINKVKTPPKLNDKAMSYKVENLGSGNTYRISVTCLSLDDITFSKSNTLIHMTRTSFPVANLKATLHKKRQVKLSWEYDKGKEYLESFSIEYKSSQDLTWQRKLANAESKTYTLSDLSFATFYNFRVQACYDGEEETSEEVNQATEPMGKVLIKKVL